MEINNIHQQFHKSLHRFILTKIKDKEDANDILQEVFIKISAKIESLNNDQKIKSWIFTIARNSIIDYYRKKSGKQKVEYLENMNEDIKEDKETDITNGLEGCLQGFIAKLPEEYRAIIIDSEINNIKQKDLAEKYNLAYPSLRSRVQRGRERLKKMLLECCVIELDNRGNILDANLKDPKNNSCGMCS